MCYRSSFTRNIAPYVERELKSAHLAMSSKDPAGAFVHLENAHVLGQESTYWHVKVHYRMLTWGIRQRACGEIFGQILRLGGAALLTVFKLVPMGNTGGANVSAVKPMPITKEHSDIIESAKR